MMEVVEVVVMVAVLVVIVVVGKVGFNRKEMKQSTHNSGKL